jgi:hypothetical protein
LKKRNRNAHPDNASDGYKADDESSEDRDLLFFDGNDLE